ncbi:RNA polymerase factor sigma-54 [Prevotella fusca]|uniref:RNA polymerase factor sigma-54 n=1 Tax=Prevotella fusca TaxID=589436 RepID=UPI003FA13851
MAQEQVQIQTQKQQQVQRLSQQQMLQVKLLEMPLTELEESVNAELDDNPALEAGGEETDNIDSNDTVEHSEDDDFDTLQEREERQDALDSALERMRSDDDLPTYDSRQQRNNAEYEEIVYGDTTSFIDKLNEQVGERELTERQKSILEYLIGSLDDDGLLRKDLDSISDELAIYHGIDATTKELEEVLKILQDFDPAGIGARSLQECLLLQVDRKVENGDWQRDGQLYKYIRTILSNHFDAFTKKHWDKIQSALSLSDLQVEALQREIRKLNPKPGSSMGETQGRNLQQITPDFIIDTEDDGTVTFSLNHGNLPKLHVSQTFNDMLETYRNNKAGMNRQEKEALLYAKEKVDKAQGFIEAVKQRRHTLQVTMKAIIDIQRKFFQDGDEADLKPMILKDIADRTGLDISTISRVSNIKYAQTRWGTFPLRFFFTDSYTTEDGEEMSTRKIKLALKEVIDSEDKRKPLSDDALAKVMKEKGFPIARRTVAKYREQLGLPVARLRKE